MSSKWDNKETFGEWILKEVYFEDGWPSVIRDPVRPVQVPVAEFVEMVMEKEHLTGTPIIWAEWPNREKL